MQGLAICFQLNIKSQIASCIQNGCTMITDITINNDFVSGLAVRGRNIDAFRNNANNGGVNKDLVTIDYWDNIGITGNDGNASLIGRL